MFKIIENLASIELLGSDHNGPGKFHKVGGSDSSKNAGSDKKPGEIGFAFDEESKEEFIDSSSNQNNKNYDSDYSMDQ